MSRCITVLSLVTCLAIPFFQSVGLAQDDKPSDTATPKTSIQLAVVEVIGNGSVQQSSGPPLTLVAPQTAKTPIGTGVKPEVTARAHVGDKPNLIPQLRAAESTQPLAAQPLTDPKKITVATQTSEDHSIPVTEFETRIQRQVLIQPQLRVEAEGPQAIAMGEDTKYKLHVTNESSHAIESVVLDVAFSNNLRITKANVRPQMMESVYRFPLSDLQPGETQTLSLLLLTSEAGPIELATRVSLSSKAAWSLNADTAGVQLEVDGPQQVSVGGVIDQRLTVTNHGGQEVNDVRVLVEVPDHFRLPAQQPSEIEVGSIAAGESRSFAFSAIGRQAGDQPLLYHLLIADEEVDQVACHIGVSSEEFAVEITGPTTMVPRQPTTFGIELSNLSEQEAKRLAVQLLLPKGMQVMALDREAAYDAKKNLLIWQIDEVGANQRVVLRLKATASQAGVQTLMVQANTADEVLATKELAVRVETSRRASFER